MGKHTLKFTETQYIGRNFLNSGGWTVSRFTWVGAWPEKGVVILRGADAQWKL